jgi:P4 family phage/plasmid primase-like protien
MRGVKARVDAAVAFSGGPIRTRATFSDLFDANLDVLIECFPTQEDGKEYGFSEADSALADKLAYWTGRNPVRMERIMRRSALLREKWDDSDGRYLKLTIRKSCAKCTRVEGETPDADEVAERWQGAPHPDYRGSGEAGEIAAKMLSEDAKSGKLTAARGAGELGYVAWAALNNTGLSGDLALDVCRLLVPEADEQDVRAVIVAKQGQMSSFRGMPSQWDRAPDIDGVEVLPLADLKPVRVARNINDHFTDACSLLNETFGHRLAGFDSGIHWWEGRRWEPVTDELLRRHIGVALDMGGEVKLSNSRINGTTAVLKDQVRCAGALNRPSVLVFFQNCVVNAVDGKVSHHSPANGNSFLLNCDYNPDATCPAWMAWLTEIFETDLQRIELLQEMFGWALVTDNLDIHKAVTWVGVQRAGKGTALKLLAKMLGDAAGAFQLADLVDDKVLAGMLCRNIVIDSDAASADRSIARQLTGRFKAITANEPVSVRLLYTQVPYQGRLNCKLFMAANSVPTLWDDSGASANRWVPLVFDKSFLGKEDSQLFDSLDAEIEGVAMWALEGLRRLVVNRRFTMPQSSRDELDSLVENASPLNKFIDEMCVADKDHRIKEAELWELYARWAVGCGFEPGKRSTFMEAFRHAARGLGVVRSKNILIDGKQCRGFYGIGASGAEPPKSNVTPIR